MDIRVSTVLTVKRVRLFRPPARPMRTFSVPLLLQRNHQAGLQGAHLRPQSILSMEFPSRYDFALSFAGPDRDIADYFMRARWKSFTITRRTASLLRMSRNILLRSMHPMRMVVCVLGQSLDTKFESAQFKQRFKSGEVIPIVLSTAPLSAFDSARLVGHITWNKAGDFDAQVGPTIPFPYLLLPDLTLYLCLTEKGVRSF